MRWTFLRPANLTLSKRRLWAPFGPEAFECVKELEMRKFGDKSYFYRKANGLPSADAGDDPGPDPVDGPRAHGFEEPEEEGKADALGDGSMEVDADGL